MKSLHPLFGIFALLLMAIPAIAEDAPQPNIIYILLDDAGYGDLSSYGQTHFTTPRMDQLAEEGMKFTQHYSGSTVCAPTRCVLMTGVHTGRAYVRGNREVKPEGQAPMPADIVTIPRLLKAAGYTTGAFGKWGLGAPGSASDPMEHFDRFYGYNCQREAHSYYPDHLWSDREKVTLDGETYAHDPIMEAALEFVRAEKDNPFFIYLPVTIPHAAMQVPEEYSAPFEETYSEFKDTTAKYGGDIVKNPVAAFPGMMKKLDEDVGRLLDLLKDLEIDENTLVMLTSDNGPHKEGGHRPDIFESGGPFRGTKRDLSEGGVRTFFLARWPGKIPAGTTSDLISAHWDMLPTFSELAGAEVPADIDGVSLVHELMGRHEQQAQHDYLYWEFYERGGKRATRFGPWKAIQLDVNKKGFDAPIALYDLRKDLMEENDVSAQHPEKVARARQILEEAHVPSPNWTFGQ